ncbi:DUF262 domain-containing protein [Alkalihalobacillus sp. NPDC078783]
MTLIDEELRITPLKHLLNMPIAIPTYQRPYSWSVKSTNLLFQDTYQAFRNGLEEYRLGSVILHQDRNRYNIVDGQQRLTTLSILLYCLTEEGKLELKLLDEKFSGSAKSIHLNFQILKNLVNELHLNERKAYKRYLLDNVTTVQIVTDNEQEAFQFFDSQNSRGKALAPHDLLKSYHLREMNDVRVVEKIDIINQWEQMNQADLHILFTNYLYPLSRWYRGKSGLYYSTNKINTFKGTKPNALYQYAMYHKSSHLFVEQFNSNGSRELLATDALNQFQLTQPILAGKRFFHYVNHYSKLLEQVRMLIRKEFTNDEILIGGTGNLYIKQLFECSLLFFADRFGLDHLNKGVMRKLYTWCYSLRVVMTAVSVKTINKYARGRHDEVNKGLDLFARMNEMDQPGELQLVVLNRPKWINDKYKDLYEILRKWNGWLPNE